MRTWCRVLGIAGLAVAFSAQAWVTTYPIRPLYQTYHQGYTDRFYTTSKSDRDSAISFYGYQDHGVVAFVESGPVRSPAAKPFNRYFVGWPLLEHFYTISAAEQAAVLSYGYVYEGVEGYLHESQVTGTTPLFRLANFDGSTSSLEHVYTTDARTRDILAVTGWQYDGVAGHVWPVPAPSTWASVTFDTAPYEPSCGITSYNCPRASDDAYIYIPSVWESDFRLDGECSGTVTVYRDNQVIAVIDERGWSHGTVPPGTLSSTWGCYSTLPVQAFGGTAGYRLIRLEFTGYTAYLTNKNQWITRAPSTYENYRYFYP
jgi:hypothetical protein